MEPLGTVLVDCAHEETLATQLEFLDRLGHDVEVCHGPLPKAICPILLGERCELIDGADGVIFAFDLEREDHRRILAKYQEIVPEDVPIRVIVKPGQEIRYAALLSGVQVWTHQPTAGEIDGFAAQVEAGL